MDGKFFVFQICFSDMMHAIAICVRNVVHQSTSESSMTQPKPVTDRIVSISDQVFNV